MKSSKSNLPGVIALVVVLIITFGLQYAFALAGYPASVWLMQIWGIM